MRRIIGVIAVTVGLGLMPAQAAATDGSNGFSVTPVKVRQGGDPHFNEPAVGECRAMTNEDFSTASNSTPPIDCAEPHTSKVFGVRQLPARLNWDSPGRAIFGAIVKGCYPAWVDTLGGTNRTRHMSAYLPSYFIPTPAERAAGARWYRCDILLYRHPNVANLPTDTIPFLPAPPLPDEVALCMRGLEGFPSTSCSKAHAWRATGTFVIDQTRYPSQRAFARAAARRCPARVTTRRFLYSVPSVFAWRAGDHTVTCSSRTTS